MNRPVTLVLVVVAIAAGGLAAWYGWQQQHTPAPVAVVAPPPPVATPVPAAPVTRYPVEDAPINAASALPGDVTLDHSDVALRAALAAVLPSGALPPFMHADRIVRNIVASVDALPRESVSPTVMPFDPVAGRFIVTPGEAMAIAPQNAARYALYLNVLQAADMRQVATVYLHFYPLFQQAYRELGYPNGYFNDRLVDVIDSLLATPEVAAPIALVQPKVLYTYADPALEMLPAGQKMMLRMGGDNAAIVKTKLRGLRAQVARQGHTTAKQ